MSYRLHLNMAFGWMETSNSYFILQFYLISFAINWGEKQQILTLDEMDRYYFRLFENSRL